MASRIVLDMMNREVLLPDFPSRIISTVPSQTELLYDLGLGDRVVGITKFCVYPEEWYRNKTRIGGTKTLDIEKIRALKPDLIIGNKEENDQLNIEEIAKEFPVWMSDIFNLDDALEMISQVGKICKVTESSENLIRDIKQEANAFPPPYHGESTVYLIWRNPYMVAGKLTFINDVLKRCGLVNCIIDDRYVELTLDELISYQPEVVLLSSEPYPFKEKHIAEIKKVLPNSSVKLVDGEMFSWYGSRLKLA
ncbi:MAG: ABC transporter substrate-binding protein, partial [Flavobacteriales bacterium]|nr:ABC transporter substrate-binding protein [Flavobacteriales bacterium]